jgi:hypothetical protein
MSPDAPHSVRRLAGRSILLCVCLPAFLVYVVFMGVGFAAPAFAFSLITAAGAGYVFWTDLRPALHGATPGPEGPYAWAWQDYRRVRRRAGAAVLLFLTLPMCVGYVSELTLGSLTPGFPMAFIAMAGASLSFWQLIAWSCPRCGEVFGSHALLNRRCRHCHLPKWDDGQDGPPGEG